MEGITVGERVRFNITTNAKGSAQIDATVESDSVERSKQLLSEGLAAIKDVIKEQGFTLA